MNRLFCALVAFCLLLGATFPVEVDAATTKKRTAAKKVSRTAAKKKATVSRRKAAKKLPAKKKTTRVRHTKKKHGTAKTSKGKYAYPLGFFMWHPPEKPPVKMTTAYANNVKAAFKSGTAGVYAPSALVQAGVFKKEKLYGGIFERREPIRHIVIHSTETERPADGPRVIKSWNRGMRHPGAQYVVDRDGSIYQTVDPAYGTVHVDIFRAQGGVNNDNAIGIEIVRAGKQKYTKAQLDSVTKLVAYLQKRFDVPKEGIVGHGHIQPSNRTDPVDFNWSQFLSSLNALQSRSEEITLQEKNNSWLIPFLRL